MFCDSALNCASNLSERASRSAVSQLSWCAMDLALTQGQQNAAAPSPDIPQRPAPRALAKTQLILY